MRVEPFTSQAEGNEVIIGRVETGVFLALPHEALDILSNLAQGRSVGETADLYQKKYGEIPDLEDFLGLMEEKGIVRCLNGSGAAEKITGFVGQSRPMHYHFANFPHTLAKRLFSVPVLVGSIAIIVFAIVLIVLNPALTPGRHDLYFPEQRTMTFALLLVFSYSTLYVHELAHLIAARAVGVNSRMGISHRLWFLVAETDLTGLWSVPRQQRILPMLAGVIVDLTCASLLVMALFTQLRGWIVLSPLVIRLFHAMVFVYVMRFVWQFLLHIRTDFYFIIASLFNCRNLMKDTETFLRNQAARFIPNIRTIDQSNIPVSELRVIRGYSLIWIIGRMISVGILVAITLPVAGRYVKSIYSAFQLGYASNPADFVDAMLFAGAFLLPLGAGFALWINSLVRRRYRSIERMAA